MKGSFSDGSSTLTLSFRSALIPLLLVFYGLTGFLRRKSSKNDLILLGSYVVKVPKLT